VTYNKYNYHIFNILQCFIFYFLSLCTACCGNKYFGRKYKSGKCCVDWDNKTVGIHKDLNVRKKCCSTELYNKDTERCIYGPGNKHKIIVRKTPMRECWNKQFNSDTSLCCEQNGT
jgi:hypothetical protein